MIASAKIARETDRASALIKALALSGIARQIIPAMIGLMIDSASGL